MIFQYQKTRKVIEALGDLMKIHIDRIAGYQSALELSGAQPSQEEMIRNIIKEGLTHKQELAQQIQQMNGDAVRGAIIYGKMYQVWMDLKVKFAGGSRKSIIASCRYNEEIVLHVYNVATIMNMEAEPGICSLLERHEAALRRTLNLLKSCKETPHFMESSAIYFN